MSTLNSFMLFRLDYLPEVVIWAGRQVLILVEAKIRAVFIFDTLVDRAKNSWKTNMNTGFKSRGRLVYCFYLWIHWVSNTTDSPHGTLLSGLAAPGENDNVFTNKNKFMERSSIGLGHQVFILRRGVRFPYALPSLWTWCVNCLMLAWNSLTA